MIEYKVDITKPPIGPPGRIIRTGIFMNDYETKESKENLKRWKKYIEEYEIVLNSRSNK